MRVTIRSEAGGRQALKRSIITGISAIAALALTLATSQPATAIMDGRASKPSA